MKKLLNLLTLALILNFTSCSNDKFNEAKNEDQKTLEVIDQTGEEANIIYGRLIESFQKTPTNLLKSGETAKINYPEYYGGAYINSKGVLVIYEKPSQTKSVISDPILEEVIDKVEIKQAKYSYNELIEIMSIINDIVFCENPEEVFTSNITHAGINDEKNRICVYMLDNSQQKIDEFKALVIDSDAIEFLNSEGVIKLQANINAGKSIFTSSARGSVYSVPISLDSFFLKFSCKPQGLLVSDLLS